MQKYKPSNGTEGEMFCENFCWHCIHCDPDPTGKKQCLILMRTLVYNIDDPKYPAEWTYNDKGEPTCTNYVFWDWDKDGEPDKPDNPKAVPPDNPNQLVIFSFNETVDELIKEPEREFAQ
jgi:hypothetical protein